MINISNIMKHFFGKHCKILDPFPFYVFHYYVLSSYLCFIDQLLNTCLKSQNL